MAVRRPQTSRGPHVGFYLNFEAPKVRIQNELGQFTSAQAILYAQNRQMAYALQTQVARIIDTNIVSTTRFNAPAGRESRIDVRREQTEKVFAARRYGPDKVARAIVSAVKKNKPIRPVAPEAYFAYGAAHAVPPAMRSAARGGNIL